MKRNYDTIKEIFNVFIDNENVITTKGHLMEETKIDKKELEYHLGLMFDQNWLKVGGLSETYRMAYAGHDFYDHKLDDIISDLEESE
jgi:hypothetical protein